MRVPALVRRFTDPMLERIPVPILAGGNQGKWWNLASAGSGYVTGRRAHRQMAFLGRLIVEGDVVWDIGAHHGFVTMLAAARCGPTGEVHAFEPSAENARTLERHVRWNGLTQVTVHRLALASWNGEAHFGGGSTSKMHSLNGGTERVAVCTAESLVASGAARAPSIVKVDVEGAEAEVLRGALPVLPSHACLLVAMHNADADVTCSALLQERGFRLIPTRQLEHARVQAWNGDPDLFCVGPDYPHYDRTCASLRAAGLIT